MALWRDSLAQKNAKAAQSIADPTAYENLFPGLNEAFKTEQFLAAERAKVFRARDYLTFEVARLIL